MEIIQVFCLTSFHGIVPLHTSCIFLQSLFQFSINICLRKSIPRLLTDLAPMNMADTLFTKYGPGSMNDIMRQLMEHMNQGVDTKVAQAAIEHLLKRLPSREELASLMTAVTTNGGQPTGCVTTKRTVDGRIHISRGKKVFPHLIFAQLWRWPQVHNRNQISSNCCYAYSRMEPSVCVNPWHYDLQAVKGLLNSVLKLG